MIELNSNGDNGLAYQSVEWLYTWHDQLICGINGHGVSGNVTQVNTNFPEK